MKVLAAVESSCSWLTYAFSQTRKGPPSDELEEEQCVIAMQTSPGEIQDFCRQTS